MNSKTKNSKIHYTKASKKQSILNKINIAVNNIKNIIKDKKLTKKRNNYIKSFYTTQNNKKSNIYQKIISKLKENGTFNKITVTTLSVILFFIVANFMVLGIKQASSPALMSMEKISPNTANTYNKILENDQVAKNQPKISKMEAKKSMPSLSRAADNFYSLLASDTTLSGDGTIGVEYSEYEIKDGDNLSSLSKRIGANLDTIVSVNKMSNANRLRPGQKILIPNRNGLLYTVKQNETLEDISDKYDIPMSRIVSFNKIDPSENIKAGIDIFLPGARYTLDERIERFGQIFSIPITFIRRVSSLFGYRNDPMSGSRTRHTGVDLPGALNTPVFAARKGIVIYAGYSGGYGNLVIVRHDKSYTTYYGHLNSIAVKEGQSVGVGTMIGRMGSTGKSTGNHLHFEIRQGGVALNPMEFIPIKKYVNKK